MTGEKDPTKDEPLTAREEYWEVILSICNALRRAAGLPEGENARLEEEKLQDDISNETNFNDAYFFAMHFNVLHVAYRIKYAGRGPIWPNPRSVEAELEEIRRDLKGLKNRITSLGVYIQSGINREGNPTVIERRAARLSGDYSRMRSARRTRPMPHDQQTLPALLSAMDQFEVGIVKVIEEANKEGDQLPQTGRIPSYAARDVAYEVAKYLQYVTGNIPGLTTSPKVTGPFALALQEIFDFLGLPDGVQKPGNYAKLKLTSELSENPEL
jgi:hypothetical protein